jgi:hypothetical protein
MQIKDRPHDRLDSTPGASCSTDEAEWMPDRETTFAMLGEAAISMCHDPYDVVIVGRALPEHLNRRVGRCAHVADGAAMVCQISTWCGDVLPWLGISSACASGEFTINLSHRPPCIVMRGNPPAKRACEGVAFAAERDRLMPRRLPGAHRYNVRRSQRRTESRLGI